MLRKTFDVVETNTDAQTGTFEALVAVFGNVDLVGDRIVPGAFSKTLEKWRQQGDPIPVILSHKADDPMAHIGIADPADVEETDRGLVVKGQLDVQDNEVAKQVHRLMKRRSLKEFSFGYTVPKGGERRAKDGANELTEVDLFEVGPTLKGANPATELQAVKSALEDKQPGSESATMAALIARMRELAAGGPPSPEAMLAFARRVMNDLGGKSAYPELEGLVDLKAVWDTAYINGLPDSAFLHIEPGGTKDGEGKTTPRSLRHFPYKDDQGNVDLPHLRNALSRIPQSSLSQDVKDRLTQKAQRLLDQNKSAVDDTRGDDRPAGKPEVQDPLRKRADDLTLDWVSGGVSRRKPPKSQPEPERDLPSEVELRRQASELMLELLTGDISG